MYPNNIYIKNFATIDKYDGGVYVPLSVNVNERNMLGI